MSEQPNSIETVRISHKFWSHKISPQAKIIVIGTFNPGHVCNQENNFFYSGSRNKFWKLLPEAVGESFDLRKSAVEQKVEFSSRWHIDFIDIISEVCVEVGQECNRKDDYLDGRVTKWRDVIRELEGFPSIKCACFTRKTFSDVPKIGEKVKEIEAYLQSRSIVFRFLHTPARAYSRALPEWKSFFEHYQKMTNDYQS